MERTELEKQVFDEGYKLGYKDGLTDNDCLDIVYLKGKSDGKEAGREDERKEVIRKLDKIGIENIDQFFLKTYDILQEMGPKASNAELFVIVKSVIAELENIEKQ
jgi:hypothetical protein